MTNTGAQAAALTAHPGGRYDLDTETFVASTLKGNRGKGGGCTVDVEQTHVVVAAPLSHGSNPNSNIAGRRREDDENLVVPPLRAWPLSSGNTTDGLMTAALRAGASVRRLTPTECERLQALPDGWTQLGNTPDSKRYAALGDAVTSTVAEWIGRRILSQQDAA